jgi:hypothetical protein
LYPSDHRLRDPDGLFCSQAGAGVFSAGAGKSTNARSVLRHIRVASNQELKERIMLGIKDVNRHPVVHTWSYKAPRLPNMIRTKETLT